MDGEKNILEPEAILEHSVGAGGKRWYLVKWKPRWLKRHQLPDGVYENWQKKRIKLNGGENGEEDNEEEEKGYRIIAERTLVEIEDSDDGEENVSNGHVKEEDLEDYGSGEEIRRRIDELIRQREMTQKLSHPVTNGHCDSIDSFDSGIKSIKVEEESEAEGISDEEFEEENDDEGGDYDEEEEDIKEEEEDYDEEEDIKEEEEDYDDEEDIKEEEEDYDDEEEDIKEEEEDFKEEEEDFKEEDTSFLDDVDSKSSIKIEENHISIPSSYEKPYS